MWTFYTHKEIVIAVGNNTTSGKSDATLFAGRKDDEKTMKKISWLESEGGEYMGEKMKGVMEDPVSWELH